MVTNEEAEMSELAPSEALEVIERALRQLYESAFSDAYGTDWLERVSTPEQRADWAEKRATEARRREPRGVATVSTHLLDYAEFYQLVAIADRHWAALAAALGDKRDTLALIRRFDQLRNTVAHNRTLLPFEEDLLSGIAGEIRNRVTIAVSQNEPDEDYWARVDFVRDSFGNEIDGIQTLATENPSAGTGLVLRVGDTVSFTCSASHPQGRKIRWTLTPWPGHESAQTLTGNNVTFTWTVGTENVGAQSSVQIRMIGDTTHHRWAMGYDALAIFYYRVLPAEQPGTSAS